MVQRIQSVYLLLAGLAFLGTDLFMDVLAEAAQAWLLPAVLGLNALTAIGAFGAIFLYSDRKKQLRMSTWLQYLAIIVLLVVFGALYITDRLAEVSSNAGAMALVGLPVLGYILIRLASRKIKKDIELVRSIDRLR